MDAAHVEELLTRLGCEKIKQGYNAWVNATCPLAPWRHASGADKQPSFGISVEVGGASKYKCHACGTSGELTYLLFTYARYSKKDVSDLMSFVQKYNQHSAAELEARRDRADEYWKNGKNKVASVEVQPRAMERKMPIPELVVLPESALDETRNVPPGVMRWFRENRRLEDRTVREWELGWHPGARRVSIPIRDSDGALVGLSGRASPLSEHEGMKPKYLHSAGFRGAFYLYGEFKAVKQTKVHLCEGFFDVMYLWQRGYNAVAMQGSNISPFQVEKLKKLFKEVVIVPDGDQPGYVAADKAFLSIGAAMPVSLARVPMGKDPDELSDDEMLELLGPPQF